MLSVLKRPAVLPCRSGGASTTSFKEPCLEACYGWGAQREPRRCTIRQATSLSPVSSPSLVMVLWSRPLLAGAGWLSTYNLYTAAASWSKYLSGLRVANSSKYDAIATGAQAGPSWNDEPGTQGNGQCTCTLQLVQLQSDCRLQSLEVELD